MASPSGTSRTCSAAGSTPTSPMPVALRPMRLARRWRKPVWCSTWLTRHCCNVRIRHVKRSSKWRAPSVKWNALGDSTSVIMGELLLIRSKLKPKKAVWPAQTSWKRLRSLVPSKSKYGDARSRRHHQRWRRVTSTIRPFKRYVMIRFKTGNYRTTRIHSTPMSTRCPPVSRLSWRLNVHCHTGMMLSCRKSRAARRWSLPRMATRSVALSSTWITWAKVSQSLAKRGQLAIINL